MFFGDSDDLIREKRRVGDLDGGHQPVFMRGFLLKKKDLKGFIRDTRLFSERTLRVFRRQLRTVKNVDDKGFFHKEIPPRLLQSGGTFL